MKRLFHMILLLALIVGFVYENVVFAAEVTNEELAKVAAALPEKASVQPLAKRKLLVFNRCEGFVHSAIPICSKTLVLMGEKTGAYEATPADDMAVFEPEYLNKFDAVLFNSTTMLKFENPVHRKALVDFVNSGKAMIGIHGASDNFYDFPEAAEMMGGLFDGHPWHAEGTWAVKIDEPNHPLNKGFGGKGFMVKDEIYQVKGPYSRDTHRVLVSLDMSNPANSNVEQEGVKRKDGDFAISWIRKVGKGRVFYCSFGHNHSIFWNTAILQHYLDGIQYALGDLKVDDVPSSQLSVKPQPARSLSMTDLVEKLTFYEFGDSRSDFWIFEEQIRNANKTQYPAIEAQLLPLLVSKKSTSACKQYVCRLLRYVGGKKSVPALTSLLADPELSHTARMALQANPSSKADTALRDSLGHIKGDLLVGILNTIAVRGDVKAVKSIIPLATVNDAAIANAAITALGRIGGIPAANALKELNVYSELELSRMNALLLCADGLIASGKKDAAYGYYETLTGETLPSHIRIAAYRGMVQAKQSQALKLVLELIEDEDPEISIAAAGLLSVEIKESKASRVLAEKLPSLSSDKQQALIAALATRGDNAARKAVTDLAELSEDDTVRLAAIKALGALGNSSSAPLLVSVATGNDQLANEASTSLSLMSNSSVDRTLVKIAMDQSAGASRAKALDILAARNATQAMTSLMRLADDEDSQVRRSAHRALAELAEPKDVRALTDLLIAATTPDDGKARQRALVAAARKDAGTASIIIRGLKKANDDARVNLITTLGQLGVPSALEPIRESLVSDNPELRKIAIRAFSSWPDAAPLDALIPVAQVDLDDTCRLLALRGIIKLASLPTERSAADTREILENALSEWAVKPEEKKVVLTALGEINDESVLELIEPYLDDEIIGTDARNVYSKLSKATADTTTGYITHWFMAGPYEEEGVGGNALLDIAFPPEKGAEPKYTDIMADEGEVPGNVDFIKRFGNAQNMVVYIGTFVYVPEKQDALMLLGSDDGVKVWLNDNIVHENNASRGVVPDSDEVKITLQMGWNMIAMKVVQRGGGWGACARIINPDGSPIKDLKYALMPE